MINATNINQYCCEDISKIENYAEAVSSSEVWDCHHRLELVKTGAVVDSSKQDLIDWGIYYNRPADELIFIKHSEHTRLHSPRTGTGTKYETRKPKYGKLHSKELSEGLSKALKGKTNHTAWNKGLKGFNSGIDRSYCHTDAFRNSVRNGVKKTMSKVSESYRQYKSNGGTMTWNDFQKKLSMEEKLYAITD